LFLKLKLKVRKNLTFSFNFKTNSVAEARIGFKGSEESRFLFNATKKGSDEGTLL